MLQLADTAGEALALGSSSLLPATAAPSALTLGDLPPDTWASLTQHLSHADFGNLHITCRGLQQALKHNDALWHHLHAHQFIAAPAAPAVTSWRGRFLAAHTACHELRSKPTVRSWCSDTSPLTLVQLHAPGTERQLTIAAQQAVVELRPAAPQGRPCSVQLFGHNGRVSCVAIVGQQQQRVGVVTASADQTVRLWSVPLPGAGAAGEPSAVLPLTLLTPLRTLRGHTESVTCMEMVHSSSGVTIAATGAKDRTVRLWGLAPLLPSPPVHKASVATLRGHGAPITCMAAVVGPAAPAPGSGSDEAGAASMLVSAGLDSRAKLWDVFVGSLVATARLPGPCSALRPAAAAPMLQPHGVFAASGSGVQLLDLRTMRPVLSVTPPASTGQVVRCFSQWGDMLALGGNDAARVYDLRALSGGTDGSHTSAGAGSSRGTASQPHRMLLQGHAGAVTSMHADRHKLVTATEAYGEAPVRVWCPSTGDCIAALGSAEPEQRHTEGATADDDANAGAGGAEAAAPAAAGEEEAEPHPQGGRWHAEWEGVTALACCGAWLVTGNSEGWVQERDYSRGRPPDRESECARAQAGRFWQY